MLTYPEYYATIDRIVNAANSADLTNVTMPNTTGMTEQSATYYIIGHYIRSIAEMQHTPLRDLLIRDAVALLINMKRQFDDPNFSNDCFHPEDIDAELLANWQTIINDMAHANVVTLLGLVSFSCDSEMQDVSLWCQTQLTILAAFCITHSINLEAIIQSI